MTPTWETLAEHGGAIIPCLIGPTGSGKTARVRAYADATGRRIETLLLGTMLPEDVLGLPRVIDGVTRWSQPAWAARAVAEPTVLFLDELDKARPDVMATVLTLIASREIHGIPLHPATRIVAAMQPVDPDSWLATETGRALSARFCYIPITYDRARLSAAIGVDVSDLPTPPVPTPPTLPIPSDRQVEWAATVIRAYATRETADAWARLLSGTLGEYAAVLTERVLADTAAVTPAAVAEAIADDPTLTEAMSIPELIAVLPHTWDTHPRAQAAILERIWIAGSVDDASAALASIHESLQSRETVWDEYPDDVVDREMIAAIRRVMAAWQARAASAEDAQ
jgi:MoxR-like ATPase